MWVLYRLRKYVEAKKFIKKKIIEDNTKIIYTDLLLKNHIFFLIFDIINDRNISIVQLILIFILLGAYCFVATQKTEIQVKDSEWREPTVYGELRPT